MNQKTVVGQICCGMPEVDDKIPIVEVIAPDGSKSLWAAAVAPENAGLRLAGGHMSFGPAKSGGFGYDGADFWVAGKGRHSVRECRPGRRFRRRYFN